MNREAHVRFSEGVGVRVPGATRPPEGLCRRSRGVSHGVAERDALANIPPWANRKDPICFNQFLYRQRNLAERFFNTVNHFRRIAARYDKLAENLIAAVNLASARM